MHLKRVSFDLGSRLLQKGYSIYVWHIFDAGESTDAELSDSELLAVEISW
jgi:hypothetical protein